MSQSIISLSFHKNSGKYSSSFKLLDWNSLKLGKYSSDGIAGSKSITFNFLHHFQNIFSDVVSKAFVS